MLNTLQLKYLFVAVFEDGTIIRQTPDDRSSIDPEKRSQFYDVLQANKRIVKFSLVGEGNKIGVDLITGIFNINGIDVLLESDKLPTIPEQFDLIFYRQRTEHFNITYDKPSQKVLSVAQNNDNFCEYFIGWKCTINGKEYKQKLAVA